MLAKKILTIDDDEDINRSLKDLLELEGYRTIFAKNGQVAMEYLEGVADSELPDLMLVDYWMPKMNGLEFAELKARNPKLARIPIIVITASGNMLNVIDHVQADGYMAKPMDFNTLVSTVKQCLATSSDSSSSSS